MIDIGPYIEDVEEALAQCMLECYLLSQALINRPLLYNDRYIEQQITYVEETLRAVASALVFVGLVGKIYKRRMEQ